MCRVEIDARVDPTAPGSGTVSLDASLPQAAVLLQFNDHESLTMQSLCSILGVAFPDLAPVIGVLLHVGILRADTPWSRTPDELTAPDHLSSGTVLYVSEDMGSVSPNRLGRVPLALIAYDGEDLARVRRTRVGLETDRRQHVKACVVRIMKDLRSVEEVELVRLTRDKMSRWCFLGEGDVISSIAALVESEYIEHRHGVCVYIA
jgi:hypothetical protein